MNNTIKIILGLIVLAVVGFGWYYYNFLRSYVSYPTPGYVGLPAETVEAFSNRLEEKVVREIGQPIEGFRPQMFMAVYPGLKPSDFDGVEAVGGVYEYENAALSYKDTNPDNMVTSADEAITARGMKTLLVNVAVRLDRDFEEGAMVDELLQAIERSADL